VSNAVPELVLVTAFQCCERIHVLPTAHLLIVPRYRTDVNRTSVLTRYYVTLSSIRVLMENNMEVELGFRTNHRTSSPMLRILRLDLTSNLYSA